MLGFFGRPAVQYPGPICTIGLLWALVNRPVDILGWFGAWEKSEALSREVNPGILSMQSRARDLTRAAPTQPHSCGVIMRALVRKQPKFHKAQILFLWPFAIGAKEAAGEDRAADGADCAVWALDICCFFCLFICVLLCLSCLVVVLYVLTST